MSNTPPPENASPDTHPDPKLPPFETSRGVLAPYGPAPSLEDIQQNRHEMFATFGDDTNI